ncbi:MAG: ABC transporter permease [Gemmatimonadetes bacterium]|uniref:ABC transporter permease n=1 Tax=Candidatus Kutchimonas denitrificans TaxID=3056748 RepID=A0AAE4ZBT5_9BACT|nr:ABC transporter permease [Gemmatimonadota bacterium]NIR76131.1 ABC transporter permease [Candidatus Kutchimonas denitrificans]NIS00510.1 ABC transporter permease [Gemmatimonadota bacterium]NIT66168.1 ABC transporter permease [Gemmatimonadota bacterium]NIU54246.1 FtsX-like permease family protein [Gemmatimonadota bacterium]
MESIWQDVRFGVRKLARNPAFAAITVLTLALGIGANTAIFSVVYDVLLRPLPFEDPDRLVMVWEHAIERNRTQNVVSPANYLEWKDQNRVFEDMAAMFSRGAVLSGPDGPQRIQASLVQPGYFEILGVDAALGRVFTPEEGVEGNDRVTVLSHGLWQRRFGGDPEIIGRTVTVEGIEHTVVGVAPAGFEGIRFRPQAAAFRSDWLQAQDLWVPLTLGEDARSSYGRSLFVLARLAPDVSLEQAQAEMKTIAGRLEEAHDFNAGWTANVVPLHSQVVGNARPALLILVAAVGLVLLIACANVANLLLAHASARGREIAVRGALGAGRRRLLRQMITESLILALAGAAVGVVFAVWGIEALVALSPGDIPRLENVGLSWPVLAFTAGVALVAALLSGVVPALQASRTDLQAPLREGGRGGTELSGRRARRGLVVTEMALAVVLLIGAGLIMRSFWALWQVDPGFQAERLISAQVTLRGSDYTGMRGRAEFADRLLERVRGLPGVESAATTVARPLGGGLAPGTSFWPTDRPTPSPGDRPTADIRMISPEYFRTMGIPLLRGREFDSRDGPDSPPVIIINRTAAATHWPDQDPIGKRMVVRMGDETPREIVGVVGDVRHSELGVAPRAKIYFPHTQLNFPWMDIMVRTASDPATLVPALRREVQALDPNLPVYSVKRMNAVVSESVAHERFSTLLMAGFAFVALVLAAVGIYGVMAYSVNQRTQEIGVRIALGAESGKVLTLVVREGMSLALLGVAIGLAVGFGLARLLSSQLYQISAADPFTFSAVALILALTALLACWFPAWRAARTDPVDALRYE